MSEPTTLETVARPTPRRGRLTVFVAAAPGAGKTYAMLEEGRRLKAQGKEVVIGLVEAYNRPRTLELIGDLDVLPRKKVHYKGMELDEMDLDAILARHPEVVLIDEIYHTNAPGAKHTWRWEDIDEIRQAGIDVLTTMNIQHLESLKDVAEQIAGMTVRETIPDHVLEDADEVQLVDISPEALRKRMKHGNIYPQQNVERALSGFFRPGNLAALRELALRWLALTEAERIGEVSLDVHENVLAAVREPSQAKSLVRRAIRISKRYRGRCTIVTVLRPGEDLSEDMEEARELTESLESRFDVLVDTDPAKAVIDAVRAHQATQVVVGAPGGRLLDRVRGSLVDDLLNELTDVDLHVIAREEPETAGRKTEAVVEAEETRAEPVGGEGGERGYLRIYVGYAPGCGTTLTMLREGQRRAGRGTDVVVAAAATYMQPDNVQALTGLRVVPPRTEPSRPGGAADMDLDAVLASGAQVVCVDDLAYTNRAPDAKFKHRYEEVEAIRRAGMKVVSTVHLRDIASMAAEVARVTGERRPGDVPDRVLDQATEVEVVDVPPKVLLERLEHHDVPVSPERREQLRQVYSIEVLGHLRELALRLVATHTDARLTAYMSARGIRVPWESMTRVMACAAPIAGLEPLLERTAQEARRAEGKLVVVSVHEVTGREDEPDARTLSIENHYREMTLKMGGQYVVIRSTRPAQAMLDYAEANQITEIVLARVGGSQKKGPLAPSIKREIIRGASAIDVHVLREFPLQQAVDMEVAADDTP